MVQLLVVTTLNLICVLSAKGGILFTSPPVAPLAPVPILIFKDFAEVKKSP